MAALCTYLALLKASFAVKAWLPYLLLLQVRAFLEGRYLFTNIALSFKFANNRNKRTFVLSASEALVSSFMAIGDVNDIFPISKALLFKVIPQYCIAHPYCARFLRH